MLSCKNLPKNETPNINKILKSDSSDSIDNDIFIFDNINDIALPNSPLKLEMPIFAICTSGTVNLQINLKDYTINKNTLVCLLPDHIIYGYQNSEDFNALFIGVSPSYAEEVMPDIHTLLPFVLNFKESPIIELNEEEVISIKEFHSFLWHKIKTVKGYYRKKIAHLLLQALLFETLNIYRTRKKVQITKRSRNEEIFYNFFQYVEHDFKVERSVSFYAGKLFITPKHLSAVVKAVSGKTAGEWIDNYVILAAKVLLRSSSQTIQEISTELNFANQSFFGKYFKQHVGMSPSEYRAGNL